MEITSEQILGKFFAFFEERGHRRIGGTTLLPPPEDPVLFVTSGMHPLIPYFGGEPHPQGRRLVNVQRCLRTTDLDEVGDDSHLTLFEMLGTWSLGDYDGPQSLRWGWQLLTEVYGIERSRLCVTVFGGSDECPEDEESERTWREIGVSPERIVRCGVEDNWWEHRSEGPCGPNTEIFVWTGSGEPTGTPLTHSEWVEVWNHVLLRYHRGPGGQLTELPIPCVDTGMGLERLICVLQHVDSVYDTDLYRCWRDDLSRTYGVDGEPLRLLCDHLRCSVVVIGDGVQPSNTGRGYVLRRLLRRCLRTLRQRGDTLSLGMLSEELISETLRWFGQPSELVQLVQKTFLEEEQRYQKLLGLGRRVVKGMSTPLSESDYLYLYETHGLPREIVDEIVGSTPES